MNLDAIATAHYLATHTGTRLTFGRFEGYLISEIDEPDYIKWLSRNTIWLTSAQIEELKKMPASQ